MQFEYTTNRLLLKILQGDAAPMVLDFYQTNSTFFEPYEPKKVPAFYTEEFQRSNLTSESLAIMKFKYLRFFIFEKEDPSQIIGSISFHHLQQDPFYSCMIGYKIAESHCHQGYAKEALLFAIPLFFQEFDIHRIEALVLPRNIPSLHLLDSLGFQFEGVSLSVARIGENWEDHYRYSFINPNR